MNVENLYKGKGGYVFVSHSHLDIEQVRKIRNFLEDSGMEPILFYLRSMDCEDKEKLKTLKRLIFDEIDAREFFLYVNSKNAQVSEWVQEELAYIRKTHPDRITVVDLSDERDETEKTLSRMIRGMRIFISSSEHDRVLVNRLSDALTRHDFRVYDVRDALSIGDAWHESVSHTITDLAGEGFVIAVISRGSNRSHFFREELICALENKVPILPIVLDDYNALWELFVDVPALMNINSELISSKATDEEIERVVRDAIHMQRRYFR